ncbi:hypothetical protein H0H92_006335 [Tricholoma furcatifolium]|nr:hypothetical protein H0H92_006335 [Tricholoma furcatifolium]
MNQKVALCTVCNPLTTPKKKKKRSKKKAKGEWDSNDEDESDGPAYPPGIMKSLSKDYGKLILSMNAQPDITFFGEKLTDEFDKSLEADRELVDLLLVIGNSPSSQWRGYGYANNAPSHFNILINKTPIRHINPDIVLLGNADDIVQYLCDSLRWELPMPPPAPAVHDPTVSPSAPTDPSSARGRTAQIQKKGRPRLNVSSSNVTVCAPPTRVGDSHVWLFEGAEGGRWLDQLKKEMAQRSQTVTPPSLTPLVVDSGANTPSPSRARTPGHRSVSASAVPQLKREPDANRDREERAAKKARP